MPRKEAEIQAALRREEKQKTKQMFDDILKNIPPHLQSRIGRASPISNTLSEGTSLAKWGGARETPNGDFSLSYDHGKAANDIRQKNAEEKALKLYDYFGEKF